MREEYKYEVSRCAVRSVQCLPFGSKILCSQSHDGKHAVIVCCVPSLPSRMSFGCGVHLGVIISAECRRCQTANHQKERYKQSRECIMLHSRALMLSCRKRFLYLPSFFHVYLSQDTSKWPTIYVRFDAVQLGWYRKMLMNYSSVRIWKEMLLGFVWENNPCS